MQTKHFLTWQISNENADFSVFVWLAYKIGGWVAAGVLVTTAKRKNNIQKQTKVICDAISAYTTSLACELSDGLNCIVTSSSCK